MMAHTLSWATSQCWTFASAGLEEGDLVLNLGEEPAQKSVVDDQSCPP